MKEQNEENLARGKKIYEPPRFMSIRTCIEQLLEIEDKRQEGVYGESSIGIGLARVGSDSQKLVAGTLTELREIDFGAPLHCFVIPGKMHFLEADVVRRYAINTTTFDRNAWIVDH